MISKEGSEYIFHCFKTVSEKSTIAALSDEVTLIVDNGHFMTSIVNVG